MVKRNGKSARFPPLLERSDVERCGPRGHIDGGVIPSLQKKVFAARVLGWRDGWIVLALGAAALLIRLLYLAEYASTPYYANPILDCRTFWEWGKEIATRSFIGNEAFFQNPLYPYILGVLMKIFGADAFGVFYLLQAILGSVGVVLIYFLAKEAFADKRVALLAGAFAAASRIFVFYDVMLLKSFLGLLLADAALLVFLMAMRKKGQWFWVLGGALSGLACLIRGNFEILVPVIIFWIWRITREDRSFLRTAGLFLAGVALVILPVAVRNYAVSGQLVLTTSHVGLNIWIGNNPENKTGAYEVPRTVRAAPKWEKEDFLRYARETSGRPGMGEAEASRFYVKSALGFMFKSPGRFLSLSARKFALFFDNYEVADNHSLLFEKSGSIVLSVLPMPFAVLLGLAVFGLVLTWSRSQKAPWGARRHLLLYLFLFSYSATVIFTFVFARYRLPVLGVMIIFAAVGVVRGLDRLLSGYRRGMVVPGIAAVLCMVFSFMPSFPVDARSRDLVNRHNNLAGLLISEGDYNGAIDEYGRMGRVLETVRPDSAEPDYFLARTCFERGGEYMPLADAHIEKAAKKKPAWLDQSEVYMLYAEIRSRTKPGAFMDMRNTFRHLAKYEAMHPRILAAGKALFNAGNCYGVLYALSPLAPSNGEAAGMVRKVESWLRSPAFFEDFLTQEPDSLWARSFLGLSLVTAGRKKEGIKLLEKFYREYPDYPYASIHLFAAYVRTRRFEKALELSAFLQRKEIEPLPEDVEALGRWKSGG